ncbi:MAG: S41 family peptidase [Acidobacteria bacterium]|nr:S41 family peptidase [Acidobacteriota bacterium]
MRLRWKVTIVSFSTALTLLLLIGVLLGQEKTSGDPYRPLSVFSEVLSRIQSDYVEEPNFSNVTEGALHGMLESLDPHSSYLSPQEFQEYQKRHDQQAGIGVIVSKRLGYVSVITVLPNSPAEKEGLLAGDILESIDGRSTREISLAEVSWLLEGAPGSKIRFSVVRERAAEPKPMEITRQPIHLPAVTGQALEAGIGYIRAQVFSKGTTEKIADQIRQLRNRGAGKFILDLRNNAYGDLEEGIATANLFLRQGLISYLEGQEVPRKSFLAEEGKAVSAEPLAVLVNASSGGAAEIVASAILENKRGEVVGERTFGIGSVQKVFPLDDGSALILSVAKYFTPVGKAIPDNGVVPSVAVEEEREFVSLGGEETEPPPETQKPREDAPLKRAIELLTAAAELPQAA